MSSEMQTLSAEETPAAAGSSFYAAMRILPRPQREAMYHVYTFCRAADDIADNGGPGKTGSRNWPATKPTLISSMPTAG